MPTPEMNEPRATYRRKNRLPQPRFQLRLVGVFAGLCVLALLSQTLVIGWQLTEHAQSMSAGGAQLAAAVPWIMVRSVLISAALTLPALMLIGVRITFRFAGPLYRIERHLESVARGESPGPCRIRKTDDMQQLCQMVNAALDSARAEGESDRTAETTHPERLAG